MAPSAIGSGGGLGPSPLTIPPDDTAAGDATPPPTSGDGVLVAWAPTPVYPMSTFSVGGPSGGGSTPTPRVAPDPVPMSTPSPGSPSSPPASAGSPGGTNVFNNLVGRDPDLLYAGETIKIEVNGKIINHVVKAGETLSSIAAANGVTVDALIKTNGMDRSLLGKNSQGQYYSTSGGPQPAPGTHQVPPAIPPSTTAPALPSATVADLTQPHSKETLKATLHNIAYLEGRGEMTHDEAQAARTIVEKALRGDKLTAAEEKQLRDVENVVKHKAGVPPSPLSPPPPQSLA
jgi:hypothetical protein